MKLIPVENPMIQIGDIFRESCILALSQQRVYTDREIIGVMPDNGVQLQVAIKQSDPLNRVFLGTISYCALQNGLESGRFEKIKSGVEE